MRILKAKLFFILIYSNLNAHAPDPSPYIIKQPSGKEIELINRGNHTQGWHEYNGWTVVKNLKNQWVYALGNNGSKLIPSNILVGIDPEPIEGQMPFIKRGIRPAPIRIIDDAPIPNLNAVRNDTFHVPLLLVEFPDAPATYDSLDFEFLMNQTGYTHLDYDNTGSFKDYFQEISYNQFLPFSEVTNWIMAPEQHSHYSYSNPDGWSHVRQLVRHTVDELENQGFDWSKFDNDGDGYVDALNIIHQGAGAEQGDHSNIWSHKSSLGELSVLYDGVIINSYTMNPEIQSGNIAAIGVLSHEFGHALGLPDLYDTDYSSSGAGTYSLMASGAWGTTGNSPWHPSTMIGWCKNQLGWVEIVNINESQNGIQLEQTYSNDQIIRINHPTVPEEYWLIENRQQVGSDTLMPDGGLAIWHVNDDIANGWAINNDEPYYGVGLEQADGQFGLENGGPSNAADIYPGLTNNREFSHSSSPNTTSLYGEPSMIRIDNISDSEVIMTFDLTFNEIILANASIIGGSGYAYSNGNISISIDNEMNLETLEFGLEFSPAFVEIIDVTALERTTFDSVIIEDNYVTIINPIVTPGSGPVLNVELFNNVGVETEVSVNFSMCIAYNSNGQEVGMNIQNNASYQILPSVQYFNILNGFGSVNGGASSVISLVNTVPISMTVFQVISSSNIITPSDEPYTDINENGIYDDGEPFLDWNNNEIWSPMVEPIDLDTDWDYNVTISENILTVGLTNWDNNLEIGPHNLIRINYSVDEQAELDQFVELNTNVLLILDAWGNNGIPFVNGSGTITINEILFTSEYSEIPKKFSLDKIYPNPFNAETTIQFSIPNTTRNFVELRAFDVRGRMIKKFANKNFNPGVHKLNWNSNSYSSGIYFIELRSGNFIQIEKVSLIK